MTDEPIFFGHLDVEAFRHSLSGYAIPTQSAYLRDLGVFCAHCRVHNVDSWQIVDHQFIRSFIASQHRNGKGSRSLARLISALRQFFKFLVTRGHIAHNPADEVRAPKAPRRLPQTLDVDQTDRLIGKTASKPLDIRDQAIWELIYSCGLRVSEAIGVDLNDIDVRSGEVRVLGKGNKERIVPVGRKALEAIASWLKVRVVSCSGERISFIY